MTQTIAIRLNAFVDAGTGRTVEAQHQWLKDTAAKLSGTKMLSGHGQPTVTGKAKFNADDATIYLTFSCRDYDPAKNDSSARPEIERDQRIVKNSEERVREVVAEIMGDKAAYCSVRTNWGAK